MLSYEGNTLPENFGSPCHNLIAIFYQHVVGPVKDKLEGYGRITRQNLKFGYTMRGQHFKVENLNSGQSYY